MSNVHCSKARVRIALADDHPVVLAGIRFSLQTAPEIDVVGEAKFGFAALEMIRGCNPDIAVLGVSVPGVTELDLTCRLAAERPNVKVIALGVDEGQVSVRSLLKAGARGYLLKRSTADDLVRAVRAVAAGGLVVDPFIADRTFDHRSDQTTAAAELSPRETEVLRLTACGFGNKEIASRLEVSVKTVETYKARASEKLGVHSRAAIVRYGATQGWHNELVS